MIDLLRTGRRQGRTTRMIDFVIQELFEKGTIDIASTHEKSFDHMKRTLLHRLLSEHHITEKNLNFKKIDESCFLGKYSPLEKYSDSLIGERPGVYFEITLKKK